MTNKPLGTGIPKSFGRILCNQIPPLSVVCDYVCALSVSDRKKPPHVFPELGHLRLLRNQPYLKS